MSLAFASLMLSTAWVFWTWAYAAHRRQVPAAWTKIEAASIAVVLIWLIISAIGIGALIAAAVAPFETLRDLNIATSIATFVAPVLAAVAVPRLRKPLRTTHVDTIEAGIAGT